MCNWVRVRVTRSSWTLLSVLTKWHLWSLCRHNPMSFFIPAEAQPKSLHSIFINVTSQWPVTPLLLIAFSIVPFAETPTMWVSSIFGNQGGLAPARESRPVAVLCCAAQSCSKINQLYDQTVCSHCPSIKPPTQPNHRCGPRGIK